MPPPADRNELSWLDILNVPYSDGPGLGSHWNRLLQQNELVIIVVGVESRGVPQGMDEVGTDEVLRGEGPLR